MELHFGWKGQGGAVSGGDWLLGDPRVPGLVSAAMSTTSIHLLQEY